MKTVLHLGISYACNMHCSHCFVDSKNDRFDINIVRTVIKYLVDNCGLLIVYYTYGEPFLGNNLYKVMEYCDSLGLIQIIMSNGSLIDNNICEELKKHNIDRVYISLDSSVPQKHDENRGYLGAFDKAIEAINRLMENGIKVGIATTINETNANDIDDIVQIAETIGVSSLSLLRERRRRGRVVLDDDSEYRRFVKDYISHNRKFSLFVHDNDLNDVIEEAFEKGTIAKNERQKWLDMNACHADLTISVAPNGDVFSCNLAGKRFGNIYDEAFCDILKRMERINERFICCT